jgi:hypothetical protein
LVGKAEGRKLFGRSRHGWEDNIKIYPKEIGWEVVNLIHVHKDRKKRESCVQVANKPSGSIKFGELLD